MVGDFGWEHEGTKSGVGTVKISHLLGILCGQRVCKSESWKLSEI